MECPVCGSSHKRFWCTRCLSDRLHAHRGVQTATSAECKSLAQQITAVLEPARPPTGISRSVEMASLKVRLSSLQDDISDSRRRVQLAKDELSAAKALMATRRREYTESRQMVESERMRGIERAVRERNDAQKSYLQTADVLMQSRRLLIRELLSIFRLRKVQRRLSKPPALGSVGACIPSGASAHVGARQTVTAISPTGPAHADPIEYRIVNVPSPVFGYALNCPRERFNAAIGHIIHMCAVLGKYLDIDFPFKVVNKGTKSCAYRNSAFAIEITRMPLYLTDSNAEHFTIGLAMLNYNIAYLCYTQGVDIPLLNVTNTLENIALCCQAMNLGRRFTSSIDPERALP
ncbi:UV radiation resistance protein/autophagy-related protein 14 [Fimicolochytrium jonesii]|uniref:UV radiation resistance protein/autophagy-related protein 14 n=1 Tax=Fimicolochytrium jonesii TaxID=1396493 RepID=UPI0022FDBFED|nr:UV radiation resistance protein/autophagy-related protein 14 [Fimicolochytrium jonesii]KAI8819539.1 UV radiation resistance protein/autophagy-related protein 14 [Fimicolochytrium jonesii]